MQNIVEGREAILNQLLKSVTLWGLLAYIPSMYASLKEGLYVLAFIDTLIYAILALIILHPKMPYRFKLIVIVSITLILGAVVLFQTGNKGAGYIWLLFSVVISALFGTRRGIAASITASLIILIFYFLLGRSGIISGRHTAVEITVITSNLMLVSIILAMIIQRLLTILQNELEEKDTLLQLLHHRVKNNLQMVDSLISLNSESKDQTEVTLAALSSEISAISAANEILLSNPGKKEFELSDIVRALCRADHDEVFGNGILTASPEQITEIAVGIADLLSQLGRTTDLSIRVETDYASSHILLKITPRAERHEKDLFSALSLRRLILPSEHILRSERGNELLVSIPQKSH
ncbi:histidine kinase dimerization/phosphoacceptor domain -containing protein [Sediminispirochaeta smaragdinae]|uniref:histidine kinase n=1 Tax=Sediminispirochaeta smaragdinae (strain DSM 11293 / JCM 15392 / SEBR 4228) TaxID=573413 RepID=E1R811_SEDSS|nr:histidine kinase dimerization/phosphoacceptor domain -containing protein [Sediminispirochaeta smaragdinae]ADK82866.1 putative signal transduction histidine kinase [Sediminispirochaeta smaragdinae DSM 11293]